MSAGTTSDRAPAPVVMRQRWSDIVWAHWPVAPGDVARHLPDGLEPDVIDGQAWVGLVPFSMSGIRLAGGLGWVNRATRTDAFGEVNVRTYVRNRDGRTGVWFHTLDADSTLSVLTARAAFGLPYRRAVTAIERDERLGSVRWSSIRKGDHATASIHVGIDPTTAPVPASTDLERFFVERYALYTRWAGRLYRGEIMHEAWQLRSATLHSIDLGIVRAAGYRVEGAPIVHVGERVEVSVRALRRVRP